MNTGTGAAAYVVSVIGVAVVAHQGCVLLVVFLATLGLHSLVMQLFAAVTRTQGGEEGAKTAQGGECTTPVQTADKTAQGGVAKAGPRREGRAPTVPDLLSPFQLEWLTVPDLKAIAKMKGLPASGLKGDLVERLTKASQNHRQVLKGDPVERLT